MDLDKFETIWSEVIEFDPGELRYFSEGCKKAGNIWWKFPHSINKWISGVKEITVDDSAILPKKIKLSAVDGIGSFPRSRLFILKDSGISRGNLHELSWLKANGENEIHIYHEPFIPPTAAATTLRNPSLITPYVFRFVRTKESKVELSILVEKGGNRRDGDWLRDKLGPKLVSWLIGSMAKPFEAIRESQLLVDIERYQQRYNQLKKDYGKDLVENWPEATDPRKFVYEDIATAAYLLCIWENEESFKTGSQMSSKPYFIDIGCGNGLLVHILRLAGVNGMGIDVRKRGIWDMFGNETRLEELTLEPDEPGALPSTEWLIGNHSDELTPWIPVLAARMKCDYFVLPCCPWDFYGKFNRRSGNQSTYQSYLKYVETIGQTLGFNLAVDRLKIPSTKRICNIGRYQKCSEEGDDEKTENRIKKLQKVAASSSATTEFEARKREIAVQNCTTLPKDFLAAIVFRIFLELLKSPDPESSNIYSPHPPHQQQNAASAVDSVVRAKSREASSDYKQSSNNNNSNSVVTNEDRSISTTSVDKNVVDPLSWNRGQTLHVGSVISLLSDAEKAQLKSQCGGLQTLLKNHRHVFTVDKGRVHLTNYPAWDGTRQRKRPCFFQEHHPDGCVYDRTPQLCPYIHSAVTGTNNDDRLD